MPQFILQEYKHPLGRPPQRIIFTKNEYCNRVKMPEWDRLKEAEPKDNDPYDPPGGNQFVSTYNRLGHIKEDPNHFCSVTFLSTEATIKNKKDFLKPDRRPMINYLTFRDSCQQRKPRTCPISEECAYDYLSTMHDSYKIPHPCVLQPLSIPKIPFLQNRKLKWEEERLDENKFYDDCYIPKIQKLQCIKGFRSKSYDPTHGIYSDGTSVKTKQRKCVELPFTQVK